MSGRRFTVDELRSILDREKTPLDCADWRLIHEALCLYVAFREEHGQDTADAQWVRNKSLEHFVP